MDCCYPKPEDCYHEKCVCQCHMLDTTEESEVVEPSRDMIALSKRLVNLCPLPVITDYLNTQKMEEDIADLVAEFDHQTDFSKFEKYSDLCNSCENLVESVLDILLLGIETLERQPDEEVWGEILSEVTCFFQDAYQLDL